MTSITTFDTLPEALVDILRSIKEGKIQLPDFQRGWIWDDEHLRSLLASLSVSYPIGAVMLLQVGNTDVRLKPRLVEGVEISNPPVPERLILDGQQRLTSLFLALLSGRPVSTRDTRGAPTVRWYYIDIPRALNSEEDRDDAILSVPQDRIVRNFRGEPIHDFSTPEKEFERQVFPLSQVFASSEWRASFNRLWDYDKDKSRLFDDFETEVIKRFEQYRVPIITLRKETPKDAVCQVFEKVNTGGVALTVFELLTAIYAADDFNLRDDWKEREKHLKNRHENRLLQGLQNTDFLQAITLLASRKKRLRDLSEGLSEERAAGITCKRKDVLRLTLQEYKEWADKMTDGFVAAVRLLYTQKIFSTRDLPYRTQLVPLAAILTLLGDHGLTEGARQNLLRWYWCGVFGELYGGSIETRFAKDLPEVLAWLDDGSEPSTIMDANFVPSRLLGLRTRNSAAYKGLYALLMHAGCRDLRSGETIEVQTYFDDHVDIHHIFPQVWCAKLGIAARRCDSIVNKTPLSARTNRMIGGSPPSSYVLRLQNHSKISADQVDQILRSHFIDPPLVRKDNFDEFFRTREEALLTQVERAMGKTIVRVETEISGSEVAGVADDEEEQEVA